MPISDRSKASSSSRGKTAGSAARKGTRNQKVKESRPSPGSAVRKSTRSDPRDVTDRVRVSTESERGQNADIAKQDSLREMALGGKDKKGKDALSYADSLDQEVSAINEAAKPKGEQNIYDGIADKTVSVTPKQWSSDRTPAEGEIARGDHLEGMLQNQGFSVDEIHTPDSSGKTLLDRVAEANDLRNPNLISSDKALKLPSRKDAQEVLPQITDPASMTDEQLNAQLSGLTPTQLEEVRAKAFEAADLHESQMFGALGEVATTEAAQKAVGQSMFYGIAENRARVNTPEGQPAPTAADLRAEYADLPADSAKKAQFQAEVTEWAEQNPFFAQRGRAEGALSWAYENYSEELPLSTQGSFLGVVTNANNVLGQGRVVMHTLTQ